MRRSDVTSGNFIKIDRFPATILPWAVCRRCNAETTDSNGWKAKITQNKGIVIIMMPQMFVKEFVNLNVVKLVNEA